MKISRLIFIFAIIFSVFILSSCDATSDELGENEVKVLNAASTFEGANYEEVITKLQEWGFTNIETEIVYDIVWGFTKEGSTKSVSIDGSDTFKYGDIFDKDVLIIITYSMREEDDPGEPVGENEAKVLSAESSFIGQHYETVIDTLEGWGFTNIEAVPVYDIIFDITEPGSTSDVKIDGSDTFKNGDIFNKDVNIMITYSMRDDDAPKYIVTWEVDGVIVETDNNVIEGTTPTYNGQTPTKEDQQNNYTFVGWSPEITAATKNQTYTAVFELEGVKEYTITWKDADGSILDETSVAYGNIPDYELPLDTAEWDYTEWTPTITEVSSDAIYTASRELKTYEIQWNDYDGTLLGTTMASYGSLPSYDLPDDTIDRYYVGWSPELTMVEQIATYTAVTVSFSKEYAFRAAVVAFTNYFADDVFMEDGNTIDMNKLHSYNDLSGYFLYIDDKGTWTRKNDDTWHVSDLKLIVAGYYSKIDVSLDVSFDGQYYIVSNLAGEAPSYSDYDSRYSSMQDLENDSWFATVSQVSLAMIDVDREIQPRYIPIYIDLDTEEHLLLNALIKDAILFPNTYNEVKTEWMAVIYSNIESLEESTGKNLSIGDFILRVEFTCKDDNDDTIRAVAFGIEYYNGDIILLGMEQIAF